MLDIDNDGMLSSAEFAEMAKLAQLERHELYETLRSSCALMVIHGLY